LWQTQECVAFNHDPYERTCQLLGAPGKMLTNKKTITELVAFVSKFILEKVKNFNK